MFYQNEKWFSIFFNKKEKKNPTSKNANYNQKFKLIALIQEFKHKIYLSILTLQSD